MLGLVWHRRVEGRNMKIAEKEREQRESDVIRRQRQRQAIGVP